MKGPSQHSFAQIPRANIERSKFNRSSGLKATFDAGRLVPIYADEALPGDTFNMKLSTFARLATPLHPILDNLYLDTFWFSVPNRLVHANFQKMMGEQEAPGDHTDYEVPQMVSPGGFTHVDSLSQCLGVPNSGTDVSHSALWHRAYNLIWNEWFRDENLQDPVVVDTDDADSIYQDYKVLPRGKRHDYFTSCLPWPQKGDAQALPLGLTAPIVATGDGIPIFDVNGGDHWMESGGSDDVKWNSAPGGSGADASWSDTKLVADLQNATAATINQLREAFQIQRLFERDARGGSRYTEIVRSHFGVVSPDARLQRPEFLGGNSQKIMFNPVALTSQAASGIPGDLAASATTASSGNGFVKSFTEHSLIIGMVCIRADVSYQYGLERQMSRKSRFDYFWPALAHLSEQAVLNKEIYCEGAGSATDDLTFGYQERYAEYRYKPSRVMGQMASHGPIPLDSWHLALDFASLPTLGADFIEDKPPIDRILAVQGADMIFDAHFDLTCARPIPTYGVPGLIDHF